MEKNTQAQPTTTALSDNSDAQMNEASEDLKMIIRSLETVDQRINRLTEKRQELKIAKKKIEAVLQGNGAQSLSNNNNSSSYQRQLKQNYQEDRDDDRMQDEDYQMDRSNKFRQGRRFFTDAFKNYTIRLSQKYSFKAVANSTGVQYNNIVRWKMEKLRGQIAPDDSYQPNEHELREEARMESEFNKRKHFSSPSSSQLDSSGDERYYNRDYQQQQSYKQQQNGYNQQKLYIPRSTKIEYESQNRLF